MTKPEPVRRIEVFTGAGRRRRWSPEEKARIVAESYSGLESACSVARRHGVAQTQLFTWRRQARQAPDGLAFAPVVVSPGTRPPRGGPGSDGVVEIELEGAFVRVGRWAEPTTVMAIIRALKTS